MALDSKMVYAGQFQSMLDQCDRGLAWDPWVVTADIGGYWHAERTLRDRWGGIAGYLEMSVDEDDGSLWIDHSDMGRVEDDAVWPIEQLATLAKRHGVRVVDL